MARNKDRLCGKALETNLNTGVILPRVGGEMLKEHQLLGLLQKFDKRAVGLMESDGPHYHRLNTIIDIGLGRIRALNTLDWVQASRRRIRWCTVQQRLG